MTNWADRFEQTPGVFAELVHDLLREVQAQREAQRGVEYRGRRPALTEGSMRDVHDLIYPRRSTKPFLEAIADVTTLPYGSVAQLAGISRQQMHYMATGRRPFTKDRLEAVAKVLHVDPGYFHEYRVLVLHELLDEGLDAEASLRIYTKVEPQHHANPRPKTTNAPNGFQVSKLSNGAIRSTTARS